MSKSLNRVTAVLESAGVDARVLEMPDSTRTAAEAATAAGCDIDQIAKSIVFRGKTSGTVQLFITAGGNQVDPDKASEAAGEELGRADADFVRTVTGFAIGGVAPVGHLVPPVAHFDPRLMEFDIVHAAAGTPRHIFAIAPDLLMRLSAAKLGHFTA